MTDLAVEKIRKELKDFNLPKNSQFKTYLKAHAIKKHVADTLIDFCRQDEEFAQAVMQSDKTLSDCCKSIVDGCKDSVSDLEVYRKAVQFYFPGSDIRMTMTIDLCASVRGKKGVKPRKPVDSAPVAKGGNITLNLADFL